MGQRRVHGELSPVLCRQCIKMADGVQLADEISDEYHSMLSAKKYRYIIFHIQDEKTIVIESTGGRDSTYDEYLEKLPDDACRYGLYDLGFQHSAQGGEDSLRKILFLMSWFQKIAKSGRKCFIAHHFDHSKKLFRESERVLRQQTRVKLPKKLLYKK